MFNSLMRVSGIHFGWRLRLIGPDIFHNSSAEKLCCTRKLAASKHVPLSSHYDIHGTTVFAANSTVALALQICRIVVALSSS